MFDYKIKMIERIDKRKEEFLCRYDKVKKLIERGKQSGEEDRLWLDEQIKGLDKGLDICSGDMLVDGAIGVNSTYSNLGASYFTYGDELTNFDNSSLDFIVTNYIEAFSNVLKVLNEWHRSLKPGGLLAFCCVNADKYLDDIGPLCNKHRLNIFTPRTIKNYLTRADFIQILIVDGTDRSMRIRCNKPEFNK